MGGHHMWRYGRWWKSVWQKKLAMRRVAWTPDQMLWDATGQTGGETSDSDLQWNGRDSRESQSCLLCLCCMADRLNELHGGRWRDYRLGEPYWRVAASTEHASMPPSFLMSPPRHLA